MPWGLYTVGLIIGILQYFNDGAGGGGGPVIFLSMKFWPKVIFWVYSIKNSGIFFERDFIALQKKN